MIDHRVLQLADKLQQLWPQMQRELLATGIPVALRVDTGKDLQSDNMGNASAGDTGTSTGTAATTLTDTGKSWTTDAWKGRVVFTGSVYGVVVSNTATVLTIDKWYAPATPGGAAASTPATGAYVIGTAFQGAAWIGLSTNATAPAAGDTTLAGELVGSGLQRALATYAHTAGASTYTLTKTYTSSDATPRIIEKIGVFNCSGTVGRMAFETAVPSPPTLVSGDQLTVTETVTI